MRYQVEIQRSRYDKLVVEVNADSDEEAAELALEKAKIADPSEWELDGEDYDAGESIELEDDEDTCLEDDSDDE